MIPIVCLMMAASADVAAMTKEIAASGRVVELTATPSERVAALKLIAPGLPPLLAFRYYEGLNRHRFSNTELMLDDAGH